MTRREISTQLKKFDIQNSITYSGTCNYSVFFKQLAQEACMNQVQPFGSLSVKYFSSCNISVKLNP